MSKVTVEPKVAVRLRDLALVAVRAQLNGVDLSGRTVGWLVRLAMQTFAVLSEEWIKAQCGASINAKDDTEALALLERLGVKLPAVVRYDKRSG